MKYFQKSGSIICEFHFFYLPLQADIAISNMVKNKTANNMTSSMLIHPGEMIKDEINARGITQKELAQ